MDRAHKEHAMMFLLLLACNGDQDDSAPAVDDTGTDDTGSTTPDAVAEALANCSATVTGTDPSGTVIFQADQQYDEHGDLVSDDWHYPGEEWGDSNSTMTYGNPHELASVLIDFVDNSIFDDLTGTATWVDGDEVESFTDYGAGTSRTTSTYEEHRLVHQVRDQGDDGSPDDTVDLEWTAASDGWSVVGAGVTVDGTYTTEEHWISPAHRDRFHSISTAGVEREIDTDSFSTLGFEGSTTDYEWTKGVVTWEYITTVTFDSDGRYATSEWTMSFSEHDDDGPQTDTYAYTCP
jgi:hypothetical protein